MLAYKGFDKGLICRGYKFKMGLNVTDKAHCVRYGFHCAEDPLDCFTYYPNTSNSVYYIVDAGGDIDEDGSDSKISCTELRVIKELSLKDMILHGLAFIQKHPTRQWSSHVSEDRARACSGYAVVRGIDPIICGQKIGDVLGILKESRDGKTIERLGLAVVDGEEILPGVWYDVDFQRRKVGWL